MNRGRCADHQPKPWARASQHTKRINRSLWEKARQARLAFDGQRCVRCGEPATEVNHIVAVADGGALYDHDNLESLCHSCHEEATRAQERVRRERKAAERL